jgi:hypothetical protein
VVEDQHHFHAGIGAYQGKIFAGGLVELFQGHFAEIAAFAIIFPTVQLSANPLQKVIG